MAERERKVLALYSNGFSHREIGHQLGFSASLSSQCLSKGRAELVAMFRSGASARDLEQRFEMPIELLAEEIRVFADKCIERCLEAGDLQNIDVWNKVIRGVAGISPPGQTRHQRRKSIESNTQAETARKCFVCEDDSPETDFGPDTYLCPSCASYAIASLPHKNAG